MSLVLSHVLFKPEKVVRFRVYERIAAQYAQFSLHMTSRPFSDIIGNVRDRTWRPLDWYGMLAMRRARTRISEEQGILYSEALVHELCCGSCFLARCIQSIIGTGSWRQPQGYCHGDANINSCLFTYDWMRTILAIGDS